MDDDEFDLGSLKGELYTGYLNLLRRDIQSVHISLDSVARELSKLGRIEERQTQATEAIQRAFQTLSEVQERLRSVETRLPVVESSVEHGSVWADKLVWAVITGSAVFLATTLGRDLIL